MDFDDWWVEGEYGNGFTICCSECEWDYTTSVVVMGVRELRQIAETHTEEAHPG
jgi:hypothetical protein